MKFIYASVYIDENYASFFAADLQPLMASILSD